VNWPFSFSKPMASRKKKAKPRRKAHKAATKQAPPRLELPTVGAEAVAEILAAAPPSPAESDALPLEGADLRYETFAQRYVTHGNATAAAIDAGYAADSAGQQGSRLLAHPKVRQRIGDLQSEAIARNGLNRDRIINELAAIGFSDPTELFCDGPHGVMQIRPVHEWSPAARRAIRSIKSRYVPAKEDRDGKEIESEHYVLEFFFWDKVSALVKLGENLGMFAKTVRVKHSLDEAAKELQDILSRGFARRAERDRLLGIQPCVES
jgi:phage terminase small subunit